MQKAKCCSQTSLWILVDLLLFKDFFQHLKFSEIGSKYLAPMLKRQILHMAFYKEAVCSGGESY